MHYNLLSYHTSFKICVGIQINIPIGRVKQSFDKSIRWITINYYISMK